MLPDKFKCVVTNWNYMDILCRRVAEQVKEDGFEPEIIVALARGGWFAGRVLCDLLDLDDLTSLKIEHYVGTAAKSGEVKIKYPLPDGSVEGKRVLIVDDIADTGGSLKTAKEHVMSQNAGEIKTATLQLLYTSKFIPDYFGEYMEEWAWVIFPWNFIEDMTDIISRLMRKEKKDFWTEWDIKWGLYSYYQIDPIHLEIAQPNRFLEVMKEMERRGIVKAVEVEGKSGWRLVE
ncbi:putative phosphoribosyltransferase [Archaeoglobus sulfaticallidus PM70-1]|uniref:Putative phosphoribosyltransferase n=1 Tax=Archaeoglobus sulfaticallidus PM70-1 TaxID=387631 RepID=N0BJ23_9EURY|nr:phosphoribosyltransferase [Archaeoglobus sulfaticallidus]AGK60461.1 putative phosphoribosyltransferase [Archaeoglobus sulfaticallidus PM70-1]